MSHPTRPDRNPLPSSLLIATFFAALIGLIALVATAPALAAAVAVVLAVAMSIAYARGAAIR